MTETHTEPARSATEETSPARIAAVVLTWQDRDTTLECLTSLTPQLGPADAVIVCDNGSRDGTEAAIAARFPTCEVLQNGANLGFSGGNNPGLKRALDAGYDWVLLLNNDTTLPTGALDRLRCHASAAAPEVAAIQPLLVDAGDESRVDSAGHGVDPWGGVCDLAHGADVRSVAAEPHEVFGACGAAALLRCSALRECGLLDERLFVMCEDADLMFRLRGAGYTARLVPDVHVAHRRGVSARRTDRTRKFYLQRNTVALALRYWPVTRLVAALPLIAWRAAQAVWLAPGRGTCLSMWFASLLARPAHRRRMREHDVDRWFG